MKKKLNMNTDDIKSQRLSIPGIGCKPSQELGGNKDWTFSKGWAEALPSNISRNASKLNSAT
jgi:hypothetical protein